MLSAVTVHVHAVARDPVELRRHVDERDRHPARLRRLRDCRRDLGVEGVDGRTCRGALVRLQHLPAGRRREQRGVEIDRQEIVGGDRPGRAVGGVAGRDFARGTPKRRDRGGVGQVRDRHPGAGVGERAEEAAEAPPELVRADGGGRGIRPRRHAEEVVVAEPDEDEARMQLARAAHL